MSVFEEYGVFNVVLHISDHTINLFRKNRQFVIKTKVL